MSGANITVLARSRIALFFEVRRTIQSYENSDMWLTFDAKTKPERPFMQPKLLGDNKAAYLAERPSVGIYWEYPGRAPPKGYKLAWGCVVRFKIG